MSVDSTRRVVCTLHSLAMHDVKIKAKSILLRSCLAAARIFIPLSIGQDIFCVRTIFSPEIKYVIE